MKSAAIKSAAGHPGVEEETMRCARWSVVAATVLTIAACEGAAGPLGPDTGTTGLLTAGKSEHRTVGGPFTGPPFWSPLADGLIAESEQYVIIPFVRQLEGGPGEVCGADAPNLLVLDPAAIPCPLTVTGLEHWQDGKWDDGQPWDGEAPRQTHHRGLGAVPIVFAVPAQFHPALAGGLSGSELLNLPGTRVGYAHYYTSANVLGLSGPLGLGNGRYTITARGVMEDGASFRLLITAPPGVVRQVHLEIGG